MNNEKIFRPHVPSQIDHLKVEKFSMKESAKIKKTGQKDLKNHFALMKDHQY